MGALTTGLLLLIIVEINQIFGFGGIFFFIKCGRIEELKVLI